MHKIQFIEPKADQFEKVNWSLPEKTVRLVEHYAEYTGYSAEEVVSMFFENVLNDVNFKSYIKAKRNNKRILKDLRLSEDDL